MTRTRHEAFRQAKSYKVIYDRITEERFRGTDVAIVDPDGLADTDRRALQQQGTLVLTYVSLVEVRPDDELHAMLDESDWLKVNGGVIRNEAFGNRLADMQSKRWRSLLRHRIGRLLMLSGYDGLFLDTAGDTEWPSLPPAVRLQQQQAVASLLQEVRAEFPDRLLLQNNGLEELSQLTAGTVDAFCWENPLFVEPHLHWCQSVMWRLDELVRLHSGLRVMLLWEENTETERYIRAARPHAEQRGWLMCLSSKDYKETH
jgi:hypothetical protein